MESQEERILLLEMTVCQTAIRNRGFVTNKQSVRWRHLPLMKKASFCLKIKNLGIAKTQQASHSGQVLPI